MRQNVNPILRVLRILQILLIFLGVLPFFTVTNDRSKNRQRRARTPGSAGEFKLDNNTLKYYHFHMLKS